MSGTGCWTSRHTMESQPPACHSTTTTPSTACLIAQAQLEGLTLVSRDALFAPYAVDRLAA